MKPLWEIKHDFWIEDFTFEQQQKDKVAELLRKHPDDEYGDSFREMIKTIDKRIKTLKREYKKIYGVNFNMNRVKGDNNG